MSSRAHSTTTMLRFSLVHRRLRYSRSLPGIRSATWRTNSSHRLSSLTQMAYRWSSHNADKTATCYVCSNTRQLTLQPQSYILAIYKYSSQMVPWVPTAQTQAQAP